jgi:hypothetical protein
MRCIMAGRATWLESDESMESFRRSRAGFARGPARELCPIMACWIDQRGGMEMAMLHWRRAAYFVAGWVFVALAALGVVLPVLPTTPFLLLASTCFLRSSPRAQRWLAESRLFGPILRDWNEHRAVRRPVKVVAVLAVLLVLGYSLVRETHWALRAVVFLVGCAGLYVLWRLPTRAAGRVSAKADADVREVSVVRVQGTERGPEQLKTEP